MKELPLFSKLHYIRDDGDLSICVWMLFRGNMNGNLAMSPESNQASLKWRKVNREPRRS